MQRNNLFLRAAILALFGASWLACSDVGDSSAVPGGDLSGDDATADGAAAEASSAGERSAMDAVHTDAEAGNAGGPDAGSTASDAGAGRDSTGIDSTVDTGAVNPGMPDSTTQGIGGGDATLVDTGTAGNGGDASSPDAGAHDTGADSVVVNGGADAGNPDAGPVDSGGADSDSGDSSAVETGIADADASTADTGSPDAADAESDAADTGSSDAGGDTGTDTGSGGAPTPCITAPCAASGSNSVHCAASANGVCTPTEQLIVAHDIAKNGQGAGANLPGSCYTCMVANACIDSAGGPAPPAGNGSGTPVTNAECGDPNGPNTNTPFNSFNVSLANVPNCLDALNCALNSNGMPSSNCTLSQMPPSVSNCYCGANTGQTCLTSPAAAIGVCAANIATDIGNTDPTTVLANFTDPSYSPGSVGLAILNCALTAPATPPAAAKCPTCFN